MKCFLIVVVFLVFGPTATSAADYVEAIIGENIAELRNEAAFIKEEQKEREKLAKKAGMTATVLVHSDNVKVPEVECDRDYVNEMVTIAKKVNQKYQGDVRKIVEQFEEKGEDTFLSCLVPSKTEVNCKFKECGNGKNNLLCVCGPKKCSLDSQGFCDKSVRSEESGEKDSEKNDDESDGSASLYTFGAVVNLALFYLVASIL